MMNRIAEAFANRRGRAAFIPFLNAGDPNLDTAQRLFEAVLEAGADIVEIGTPYSDPLADGPTIQASALRSLQSGFRLPHAFELAAALRAKTNQALVMFTYVNPLIQFTPDRFFQEAARAGVDGVIVPDLPFEESEAVRQTADDAGVALIPLVSPTSGPDRIAQICTHARGFVYCVSSLGVTGERATMSDRVRDMVETARQHTTLPIAVGFGVSTPAQAAAIADYADGVIVGSALVSRIEQALQDGHGGDIPAGHASIDHVEASVRAFAESLKHAVE